MASLDANEAQALIGRVVRYADEAAKSSEAARAVKRALEDDLRSVMLQLNAGPDGSLPAGTWEQLTEAAREDLQERLGRISNVLATVVAGAEEPSNPHSIMYRAHASNGWVILLVAAAIVIVGIILSMTHTYWDTATSKKASEADILRMVMLMGALGGTLHWMSSLVNYIGNGNFYRRWIPYYLLAPFQGAALAVVVFLMLRVGVLANPTGNSAEQLNLLGLYAFSGLTGLFAKQAIEMLRDVFGVIFKRIDAKDPAGSRRPPASGDAAKAGGKP